MVQSAINATRRVVAFAKIPHGDVNLVLAKQAKYLALVESAPEERLLPYEALVMKQYWTCYGQALREALEWFGPRKRARFVTEFVLDSSGRARGYSPVDAAINYLHQRRLRQAERINGEVGFPGACDGFIHGRKYNSRKLGLLLDMIDPFKFADREELLLVVLNRGLTWRDFKIQSDRRGSNFYYPRESALSKLNEIGTSADNLVTEYRGRSSTMQQAYRAFAEQILEALTMPEGNTPELFVLGAAVSD
jgi:CRISPR/Cas system-associated endonuclease Cas1